MTEKDGRDLWKKPPRGSEGDAHKDFEPAKEDEGASQETDQYTPRHRAPGRPPLIRRRRNKDGESEEVTWETPWTRSADSPRWSEQEDSAVAPSPAPIEDVPYLGPTRAEQRRKRGRASSPEEDSELTRRSRDYTGRHLAPRKPGRWTRGGSYEESNDAGAEEEAARGAALVEGDVEREDRIPTDPQIGPGPVQEVTPEPEGAPEPALQSEPEPEPAPDATAPLEPGPTPRPESGDETQPGPLVEETPAPEPESERRSSPEAAVTPQPEPEDPEAGPTSEAEASSPADPEPTLGAAPARPASQPIHSSPEPAAAPVAVQAAFPTDLGRDVAGVSGPVADADTDPDQDEDEDDPSGPRTAALHQRKRKKRTRQVAGAVAAVVLALGAIGGAGLLVKNVVDPEKERVAVPLPPPEEEALGGTTLVFGTKESSSSGRGAIWMTLLSLDPETGKGSVVYIPPHTAVEVPGRGLQGVGEAYGSGGVPLLLVSAENLLGVKIDRYLELSDKDALVFFEKLESLTVDVPAEVRVPVGKDQARLIFVEGPQELTPGLLVKLLYIVGIDGDDVELGSRHLAFWDELLDRFDDGSELASAVAAAGPALGESDASPEQHAEFLAALADLPTEDLTITTLPVRPISAGESELYATDEDELVAFVEETIGVDQKRPQEIRVQVLNGNGVPGIGQEVADQLVGEGFRVILSGNARRLNYGKTLVIAYDSSDEGVALAERARDLLGVGEVQVSVQEQGIVDLTIVVGKDFLRAR